MSYIEKNGDWETRKISVMGTLQSFISQLSIGQEITKVSLPAVILSPYSALEVAAFRGLSFVHELLRANREKDPFKRFLCVLRWYLSYTQKEKMKRKPYNPILGEHHSAWVETPSLDDDATSKQSGYTKFFGEQTSHHPPVTSFIIENTAENVLVEANVIFSTKFYGNSAGVLSSGKENVHIKNFGEVYTFSKGMPDIMVRNMILGTKRIAWEGETILSCEQTGYKAVFTYKEDGWHCVNVVKGKICKGDTKLYTIQGACGDNITLAEVKDKKATQVVLEPSKLVRNKMRYLASEKLDPLNSLKVWEQVSKAIEEDDMYKADVEKRVVEDAQRKRRNDGTSLEPTFFKLENDFWIVRPEKMAEIDNIILESITVSNLAQLSLSPKLEKKKKNGQEEEEEEDEIVEAMDG